MEVTFEKCTSINYGRPLFYHPQIEIAQGVFCCQKWISFYTVAALVLLKKLISFIRKLYHFYICLTYEIANMCLYTQYTCFKSMHFRS